MRTGTPPKSCNIRVINARKVESRPKCLGACALCAAVDGIVKFKWGGNVVTDLHYCVSTYSSRTRHTPPPAGVPQDKSSRGGLFTAAENTLRHPMQPHIAPGIASTVEL